MSAAPSGQSGPGKDYFEPEPPPPPLPAGGASPFASSTVALLRTVALWLVPNLTAFIASFCIMVIELVAGRIIARHLGSSLYTWTSVIGIVLAGITIGNLVGGRLADWFKPAAVLAVLFLLASGACLAIPLLNGWIGSETLWDAKYQDANFIVRTLHWLGGGKPPEAATEAIEIDWGFRIFGHVFVVFLIPATLLGTIGPVVAKMALDQGRKVGRTVGNVYAWGALGSIVGTFITGYKLISWLGTGMVIQVVAGILALMGVLYSLTRLWNPLGPRAAIISFLAIFWAWWVPASVGLAWSADWGFFKGKSWPYEWVPRDGHQALREKAIGNSLYNDESDYSYIHIERESPGEDGDGDLTSRELKLDNLIHAYYVPEKPRSLKYDYEDIYKALTHLAAPAGATPIPEKEGADEVKALEGSSPSVFFIGGGGYVFPRYLRSIWPACEIEVAEIDPAVTRADIEAFGLQRDDLQILRTPSEPVREGNPIRVYHLDARLRVVDLARRIDAGLPAPRFDFVYGDAFNFLAVPFHLTTFEFNEKVKKLLKPGTGVYMINVIDLFKATAKDDTKAYFLAAIYATFQKTFEHVYVFSCTDREPSGVRDTYIVAGSLRPLDVERLPEKQEPYKFTGHLISKENLENLMRGKDPVRGILTDDYAPVENLLRHVFSEWGK